MLWDYILLLYVFHFKLLMLTLDFQITHKKQVFKWEPDVMATFLPHIWYGSILHIPLTTIDVLVSALWPINRNCLHFLVRRSRVYSWERGQNGENRNRGFLRRGHLESTNNWKGMRHAGRDSLKWTCENPGGFSLWRAETRGSRWDMRRDAFHDTHTYTLVHTHTHTNTRKHQSFFGWRLEPKLKSDQSEPAGLLESNGLWSYILIYARSPACGLVNGSK